MTPSLFARVDVRGTPDAGLFSQIRGSLTLMGPLLARFGRFAVQQQRRRRRHWPPPD